MPGVAISYDEGRSFCHTTAGPCGTVGAFMTGKDEFVVFAARSHRSDSPPLRLGQNILHVALRRRNPRVRNPLVLTDVEVLINYPPRTQETGD